MIFIIDCENAVFDTVAKALRAAYKGIFVAGEYMDTPASFPAVTVMETSNTVYERMRTTEIERAVRVLYEANVYSNKQSGKKAECKKIMDTLDAVMKGMGFTRTFRNQVPNLQDATIYRIVARYEAVVVPSADGEFIIHTN